MAKKAGNNFNRYSEENISEEFFNYNKENNEAMRNSLFVYKHDTNNELNPRNYAGEEVNTHFKRLKGAKKASFSQENAEQVAEASTTTATAATAGSTVATVAAVTTTAVVVIAGGGIVINEFLIETPNIRFVDAYDVGETSFSITFGLGNDEQKLFDGEPEEGECNITIELTCESYSDFLEQIKIETLGLNEHTFENLVPETEYTLKMYTNKFLDIDREEIDFDGAEDGKMSIITLPATPEIQGSINFEKDLDPFGDLNYFVSFDDVVTDEKYTGYYLQVFEYTSGSYGNIHYADEEPLAHYEIENPYLREKVYLHDIDPNGTYRFRLIARYFEEEHSLEEKEDVLFEEPLNLATIQEEDYISDDQVYIRAYESTDSTDPRYFTYVSLTEDTTDYSNYYMEFYEYVGGTKAGSSFSSTDFDYPNTVQEINIEFGALSPEGSYLVEVLCESRRAEDIAAYVAEHPDQPEPSYVDITLREQEINFFRIRKDGYFQDKITGLDFEIDSRYFEHDVNIVPESTNIFAWENFSTTLTSSLNSEQVTIDLNLVDGILVPNNADNNSELWDFLDENTGSPFDIKLYGFPVDSSDSEASLLYEDESFVYDGGFSIAYNTIFIQKVHNTSTDEYSYRGFISLEDDSHYTNFTIDLYNSDEDGQKGSWASSGWCYNEDNPEKALANKPCTLGGDLLYAFNLGGIYIAEISCESDLESDIDKYNAENPGSEHEYGNPVPIILLDFVVLDTTTFMVMEI